MHYHMIRTDDMLNGDGLRIVLFLSGCNHYCQNCHNPETWNPDSGKEFGIDTLLTIIAELDKDYISGITFSGGDPLYKDNIETVKKLIVYIKTAYPDKTIWLYTGYTWEQILNEDVTRQVAELCDVIVDGMFASDLADVNYPWAGSTNQRVIDVQRSLNSNRVILCGN